MQERHGNRDMYFTEQQTTLHTYILPYIEQFKKITPETRVLEIGCSYGGNLMPFIEKNCYITGIDLLPESIEDAKRILNIEQHPKLTLIAADIYDVKGFEKEFDIIFMKDTIEHIPNQEKFVPIMKRFLKDDGIIFQGFPPWCNPFGGHQQVLHSRFLSKLPWFHLLPRPLFRGVLKLFGETEGKIENMLASVYDTGISIQRFKRIVQSSGFSIEHEQLYFINPNYEVKFKLKPRKLWSIFNIPYLRDFYTTTAYFILKKTK